MEPEWITAIVAAAGFTVTIGALIWRAGSKSAEMKAEVASFRRDLNGPLKEHFQEGFDSAARHNAETKKAVEAVQADLATRWPKCETHDVALETLRDDVDRITQRQDREATADD